MSGPVRNSDVLPVGEAGDPAPTTVEVTESREAQVGTLRVRRALPRQARRMVGAWCFVDHMGPAAVTEDRGIDIGPHPHTGLQTVTWLVAGEVLHRDSLGSEQIIRPGQLNLMTAGHGVSHAEERTGSYRGDLHGVQLWVAQPEQTRHGRAAFEHHPELPRRELNGGTATVIVGNLDGTISPARRDTDHLGIDLDLRAGNTTVPADPRFEYAIVVLTGALAVEGRVMEPGYFGYLGTGRDDIRLSATDDARALLIGGVPFDEPILMWWNFVARTREEVDDAQQQWTEADERFGTVDSDLPRIPVGSPPWTHRRQSDE
ncbi:MAG: pirin family protein [Nocardioidaceae bacterium]